MLVNHGGLILHLDICFLKIILFFLSLICWSRVSLSIGAWDTNEFIQRYLVGFQPVKLVVEFVVQRVEYVELNPPIVSQTVWLFHLDYFLLELFFKFLKLLQNGNSDLDVSFPGVDVLKAPMHVPFEFLYQVYYSDDDSATLITLGYY